MQNPLSKFVPQLVGEYPRKFQSLFESVSIIKGFEEDASVDLSWTKELKDTCDKANITFFTTPYDLKIVEYINDFVPAFKIGSGDITWLEMIEKVASKNKPYLLATGASTIEEVILAVGLYFKLGCLTIFASKISPTFFESDILESIKMSK